MRATCKPPPTNSPNSPKCIPTMPNTATCSDLPPNTAWTGYCRCKPTSPPSPAPPSLTRPPIGMPPPPPPPCTTGRRRIPRQARRRPRRRSLGIQRIGMLAAVAEPNLRRRLDKQHQLHLPALQLRHTAQSRTSRICRTGRMAGRAQLRHRRPKFGRRTSTAGRLGGTGRRPGGLGNRPAGLPPASASRKRHLVEKLR